MFVIPLVCSLELLYKLCLIQIILVVEIYNHVVDILYYKPMRMDTIIKFLSVFCLNGNYIKQ